MHFKAVEDVVWLVWSEKIGIFALIFSLIFIIVSFEFEMEFDSAIADYANAGTSTDYYPNALEFFSMQSVVTYRISSNKDSSWEEWLWCFSFSLSFFEINLPLTRSLESATLFLQSYDIFRFQFLRLFLYRSIFNCLSILFYYRNRIKSGVSCPPFYANSI